MFCSKCGKEIAPDAAFCPNCGTKVEEANEKPENKQESDASQLTESASQSDFTDIKLTEVHAGEAPLAYMIVLILIVGFASLMWGADSRIPSLYLWCVAIFTAVYTEMLLPRMVSYDTRNKKLLINRESIFIAARKSFDIDAVMGVRLRKVKLGFSSRHALSQPGEYFVFAFDTKYKDTNQYLWFQNEKEFREFENFVRSIFKENNKEIPWDENLGLIKTKEFYAQETKEKTPFNFSKFLQRKKRTLIVIAILFFSFCFISRCAFNSTDYASATNTNTNRSGSFSSFSNDTKKAAPQQNPIDAALDKLEDSIEKVKGLGDADDFGSFMSEYSKAMKGLQEAQEMLQGYDDSDMTPEQWNRLLELRMKMY